MLAGIGVLIFGAQFHVMVDEKPRESGLQNLLSIPSSMAKSLFPADGTSHHLAAGIGVGTILILILWTRFAPKKLKWIPGALVAVSMATAATAALALPIRRVNIDDNFFGSLRLLDFTALPGMITPELLLLAVTVAFDPGLTAVHVPVDESAGWVARLLGVLQGLPER